MGIETYNFSDDFQEAIIASLVRHPDEFWTFGQIIKAEYFSGAIPTEVVDGILSFQDAYGKYPNFTTLGNYLFAKNERRNADRARELVEFVEKVSKVDTADYVAVRDMAAAFARERSLLNAIKEIYQAQQEGRMSEIEPVQLVEKALMVGKDQRSNGINLLDHMWQTIKNVSSVTYGVQTGYSLFDNVWKTGWAPGWLIVPLAPPKCFKSACCVNLAYNMVGPTINSDVIYLACEISEELAMMRALYRLSGQTENNLFEDGAKKFFKKCQTSYVNNIKGKLWFKGFPSKTATVSDLKQYCKHLMLDHGVRPRAIFIDYAETVKPSSSGKGASDWRQQADIYTEARAMGQELNAAIVMPDRCNRETVGHAVPNMSSFQGAFEKAGIVDAAIGLCCTPEERLQKKIRYFIFLNRHGEQYQHFEGKVDAATMTLTVDRDITSETNMEEVMGETAAPKRRKSNRPDPKDMIADNPAITQDNG